LDSNTAIGLGVFALGAVLLGWIVRTFVRALMRGVGGLRDLAAQQAAEVRTAQQQLRGAAVRQGRVPGPQAAPVAPGIRAAAPRAQQQRQQPGPPRSVAHHRPGSLLSPFRGGESLLRSIIVSEALGPPLSLRRPETR